MFLPGRMIQSRNEQHLEGGFLPYQPALAGNAFMLAAFAALIPLSLFTGYRYKTPLYTALVICGLVVEVIGHVGAVLLQTNILSHA